MKNAYVKIFLTKCLKKKTYKKQRKIILWKKNNGGSFNSKGKIYNSKELEEKSSTVESETTEIFHEKIQ